MHQFPSPLTATTYAELYEVWKTHFYLERGSKAREGMLARVQAGWFSGPAPLGYLNSETAGEPYIVLDPVRAPLVAEALTLLAAGRPLREALRQVTAKGLRSKEDLPLTYSSLQRMVTNPFYCGELRYLAVCRREYLRVVFDVPQ